MAGEEPPYLTVGTDVSAKYKGAFCEAKIKKVTRSVKCKLTFKNNVGAAIVTDDQVKGTLRVGAHVEAKHPEKNQYLEAVINKLHDYSQYTVVFDDGDETTLRRTSLCLKSGRHFAESETLDQLPLTHPEHFGTPVMGSKGRKRRSLNRSALAGDSSDEEVVAKKKVRKPKEVDADMGKVMCIEMSDRKKQKDNWFPAVVVSPGAHQIRVRTKDEYLVRSFKDGKYHVVIKKDTKEFTKEIGAKVENNTLKTAVDKAMLYHDKDELPAHWDRDLLFGAVSTSNDDNSDQDSDSDTSDDEPSEVKDRFVAQLYKFMDDRGTPINKAPAVSNKDLNLYKLFKVVQKMSGYNRVTNQMQWKAVYNKMGLPTYSSTSSHQIKQAYKKYLHSFEDFYRKLGCTMGTSTRSGRVRNLSGRSPLVTRERDREFKAAGRRLHKHAIKVVSEPKKPKEVEGKEEAVSDDEKEKDKKEKIVEPVKPAKKIDEVESTSNEDSLKSKASGSREGGSNTVATEDKRAKGVAAVVKPEEKKVLAPDTSEDDEDDEKDEGRSRSRGKGDLARADDRRRGRKKGLKKKEGGEDGDKSLETDEETNKARHEIRIVVGDRVKVKYGRGRQEKIYEAKVLKLDEEEGSSDRIFFVHYTGWNMRYDEWVKKHRIVENLTRRTISKRTRTSMNSRGSKGPSKRGRPHGKTQGTGPPPGSRKPPGGSKVRATRSDRNSLADSPFANGLVSRRRTRRSSGPGGSACGRGSSSEEEDEDDDDGGSESGSDDDERAGSCDSPPADKKASSPEDLDTSLEDAGLDDDDDSSAPDEPRASRGAKGSSATDTKIDRKSGRVDRGPPPPKSRRAPIPKAEANRITPKSASKPPPSTVSNSKSEAAKESESAKSSRAKLTRSLSKELAGREEGEADEEGSGSEDEQRLASPRVAKTRGRPAAKSSPARPKDSERVAKAKASKKAKPKKQAAASDSDDEAESDDGTGEDIVPASAKKIGAAAVKLSEETPSKGDAKDELATGRIKRPTGKQTPKNENSPRATGDDAKRRSESNLEKQVGIEVRVDTVAHAEMAEEEEEPPLASYVGLSRVGGRGAATKGKDSPARPIELDDPKVDKKDGGGREAISRQVVTSMNILEMDDEMKRISSSLMSTIDPTQQTAGVLDNSAIFGTPVDEVDAFAADYCPVMDSSCDSIEMDNIFPPGLMESVKAVATPEGDAEAASFMPGGRESPSERSKEVERDFSPAEMTVAQPSTSAARLITPVVVGRLVDMPCGEGGKLEKIEAETTVTSLELKEQPVFDKSDVGAAATKDAGSENIELKDKVTDTKFAMEESRLHPLVPQTLSIDKFPSVAVESLPKNDESKLDKVDPVPSEMKAESVIMKPITGLAKMAEAEALIARAGSKGGEVTAKSVRATKAEKARALKESGSFELRDLQSRKVEIKVKEKAKVVRGESKVTEEKIESSKDESREDDSKSGKESAEAKVGKLESSFIKDESRLARDGPAKERVDAPKDVLDAGSLSECDTARNVAKTSVDEIKGSKEKAKPGKEDGMAEVKIGGEVSKIVRGETKLVKEKPKTDKSEMRSGKEKTKTAKDDVHVEDKNIVPVEKPTEVGNTEARVEQAVAVTEQENSVNLTDESRNIKVFGRDTAIKTGKEETSTEQARVRLDEPDKEEAKATKVDLGARTPKVPVAPELKLTEISISATKETIATDKDSHVSKASSKVVLEESRFVKDFKPSKAAKVAEVEGEAESSPEIETTTIAAKVGKKERRKQRSSKKPEKRKSAALVPEDDSSNDNPETVSVATPDEPKLKKRKTKDERDGKAKQRSRDKRSKKKGEGAESSKKRKGRRRDWKRKRGEATSHSSLVADESDADASTASSEGGPAARKPKERRSKKHKGEQERKRGGKRGGSKSGTSRGGDDTLPGGTTSDESGGGHAAEAVKRVGRERSTKSKRKRDKEREKAAAAAAAAREVATSDDSSEADSMPTAATLPLSLPPPTQQQQDAWMTFVGASHKEKSEAEAKETSRDESPVKERRDLSSYLICEENVPASPVAADGASQMSGVDEEEVTDTPNVSSSGGATMARLPSSEMPVAPVPFVPLTMRHKMSGAESMTMLDNTPPTTPESAVRALAPTEVVPSRRPWEAGPCFSVHAVESTPTPTSVVTQDMRPVAVNEGQMDHLDRVQCLLDQCSQGDRDLLDLAGLETRRGRGGVSGEGLLEGLAAVAGAKREQAASLQEAASAAAAAPTRRRRRNLRKHHHHLPVAGCDPALRHAGSSSAPTYGRHRHGSGKNLKGSDTEDLLSTSYHSMGSTSSPPSHQTGVVARSILDQHMLQQSPRPSRFNFFVELDDYSDGAERIAVLQEKLTELRKTYLALKAEVACIDRRRKKLKRKEKEASNGTNLSSAVLECS